jgi:dUTP pyrophosphatase
VDLKSAEDVTLLPGERCKIKTGLAVWTGSACKSCRNKTHKKNGIAALVLPRSGLGTKGLVLANTIGLIDEDYQGELIISAWNSLPDNLKYTYNDVKKLVREGILQPEHLVNLGITGDKAIYIQRGDRIAQLMFTPVIRPHWNIVEEFSHDTSRGAGGFNSTGTK